MLRPSGNFSTWLAYQLDPNDTPFMVQSLYGREYFPNGGAYLQRFALTGSIYGGPLALELIELDAKGDRVFAKIHVTAPAGFEWDVYQIIDMDPNLTFKFTALDLYSEGYKQKYADLAAYEAIGYTAPPLPPLPAPFCTYPFSSCAFGVPSNTAAELANLVTIQGLIDAYIHLALTGALLLAWQ